MRVAGYIRVSTNKEWQKESPEMFNVRGDTLNKLIKIMLIFLIVLIFVFVLVLFVKVQTTKTIYEKRVTNYLLNEQGYEKKEIKSVEGEWGIKLPQVYTIVVFKDEPLVKYIYFAHDEVVQVNYILSEELKKSNIDSYKLKHYVPYE
ncbi:DUF3139 domain-containing protein [Viridibacillus arvi]|uniref:DUF3139 domain-containing protein n=1 Tax=Viridibacillus arvi TaxID=263475 RepID=UPI0036E5F186